MVIDKNSIVIIKDNNIETIGFIPVTEEIATEIDVATEKYYTNQISKDDFVSLYGYVPNAFIMYGKTSEVDSNLIAPYIDCVKIKKEEKFINSYKCFSGEKFGLDYTKTVLHGSPLDSWRCLMTSLGHPEFGVIVNTRYL